MVLYNRTLPISLRCILLVLASVAAFASRLRTLTKQDAYLLAALKCSVRTHTIAMNDLIHNLLFGYLKIESFSQLPWKAERRWVLSRSTFRSKRGNKAFLQTWTLCSSDRELGGCTISCLFFKIGALSKIFYTDCNGASRAYRRWIGSLDCLRDQLGIDWRISWSNCCSSDCNYTWDAQGINGRVHNFWM